MTVKKLTIKAETVDYAIKSGLEKLGLAQDQTHIEIIQRDAKSMFGDSDAIIAITYDEDESTEALETRSNTEFKNKFSFRFLDGQAQVRVPNCFYDPQFLPDPDARSTYLTQYLRDHKVAEPEQELIDKIANDFQCQYDFFPVKNFTLIPINDRNANLVLEVSDDKMEAQALIFHGQGCTVDEVKKTLIQQQVVAGVLEANIQQVVETKHCGWFQVAQGVPAVNDKPATLEKFFHEDERKEFAKMMELLTIDTRQIKEINVAERNQLLIRIGEVIPGTDGYDITGTALPKESITDESGGLKLGNSVRLDEEKKEVFATESGHIVWRANEFFLDIEPLYVVEGNVDFNEGNIIDFVGKVLIKGDVMPKFRVSAMGDIEVHGTVQDADLFSHHGDVMVAGSIVNKNEGQIIAARTVHCAIATNAKIHAQTIVIEKEAMNSQLVAVKEILAEGNPGVIVGGHTEATERVRANTIGSESWVPTKIHIGDVSDMKKRLRSLRQLISQQSTALQEAEAVIRILEKRKTQKPLVDAQIRQLEGAQNEVQKYREALEYAQEEEEELRSQIEKCRPARLEILKELHPQVDVFIFEGHMIPTNTEQYTGFRCKDGRIQRYAL